MTLLQEKLIAAANLLIEVRELARINGQAYRAAHPENLSFARSFERMADDLKLNNAITIEKLIRLAENRLDLLDDMSSENFDVSREAEYLFRRHPEWKGAPK